MSQLVRQSGITYLCTEKELSQDHGFLIEHPIRVFNLEGIGVHRERFLADLSTSFQRLSWDDYDVKREQVAFLRARFPGASSWFDRFLPSYYAAEAGVIDLVPYFRQLSTQDQIRFERIRSYRRRSIAKFDLTNRATGNWEDQWHVTHTHCRGFRQEVGVDDPRTIERIFDPTAAEVVEHVEFQRLVIAVAEMTEDAEVEAGRHIHDLELTFHQMGLTARAGVSRSNAPEGIHQDGADYIVSALVIARESVIGGTSIITGSDKTTRYLEATLSPGEGIFQADKGSPLWHDVTPITVIEGSRVQGIRNIFGFDVNVRRE
jgi:hypothetical protein